VDQYVDTGFQPDFINTNATMSYWCKMADFTGEQITGCHNNKRFYAGFNGTNAQMGVADVFKNSTDISAYVSVDTWHHICLVADGGTATYYVDGVARDTMSYTQDAATNPNSNFLIGAWSNPATDKYMAGDFDEVAIWNVALDADAVTAVYNSGAPNNLNQDNGDYTNSGDLQGWWRMGEGNDPGYYLISDASGNGNDGTTQNEPAWSNDTPQRWPQNFSYYGIEFDGVDQYMTTTADDTLATKSYSFWAKSDDTAADAGNAIFDHGGASTGSFIFNFYLNRPLLYMAGSCFRYWDDNSAQDDDAWHHHVVYIEHDDITNCKWYVDGVVQSVNTTSASAPANAYTTGLRVGGGSYFFDGSLDEFAVFDGELTSAQVTALYNSGKPAAIAGAEHWYRMGEGNTVDGALVTDLAATDSKALYLPGVSGNYASVPDAADLDGFGDFTFEATVALDDWTSDNYLISKTAGGSQSYFMLVLASGEIRVYFSSDGSAWIGPYDSTVATGVTDGASAQIRAVRDTTILRFYVDGVQLGDNVTCSDATIYSGTENVQLGMREVSGLPMKGSISRARIWSDATQTTNVLDIDFSLPDKGASSFTATSGQTVTVNTTSIADPAVIRQATDGVNVNSPAWTKNTPS
jgi:hypothetical protein